MPIPEPTGLTRDSRGNLYYIDAGLGMLRLVRASDGLLFDLRMTLNAAPFGVPGAQDLRVRETAGGNFLYGADGPDHIVFRIQAPANLADLDAAVPAAFPIEIVLGVPAEPGYRAAAAAPLPTVHAFYDGVPLAEARLNDPASLDLDADGKLVVAESGRVRLLDAGKVYTIAGGFDTR